MLARYRIVRGKRPPEEPLPEGVRIDVRKHTRHVLAPEAELVDALLEDASDPARLKAFAQMYGELLGARFASDRDAFDRLAATARDQDVYLGCSCPTGRQPNVLHCHTVLALRFMRKHYRTLDVRIPTL